MELIHIASNKSFDGWHKRYRHSSSTVNCEMQFAIYLPPQASAQNPVPVLYWLSGLTCTDENFMQKAGAQRIAAELGMAIVAPDTSPRGEAVADADRYDLGKGAGFYVNATQQPWAQHYQMYDYIVAELPQLIEQNFPVTAERAIAGHSMGGHGALMIALRNPDRYRSASAFSPIANPSKCPWGEEAFSQYLGNDRELWESYDSSILLANAKQHIPILVDQGMADEFLAEQLRPEALETAVKGSDYPLTLRRHEGYDHSYYFIASFIAEHLKFHAQQLFTATK